MLSKSIGNPSPTLALTTFAAMAANHLHDLITDEMVEIFVDDRGMAADTFQEL
jgi:hypothetical protein